MNSNICKYLHGNERKTMCKLYSYDNPCVGENICGVGKAFLQLRDNAKILKETTEKLDKLLDQSEKAKETFYKILSILVKQPEISETCKITSDSEISFITFTYKNEVCQHIIENKFIHLFNEIKRDNRLKLSKTE